MRRSIAILTAACLLAGAASVPARAAAGTENKSEDRYLVIMTEQAKNKKYSAVKKTAAKFFRAYPRSPRVPDARLILADIEDSPDEAVTQYRAIVGTFRNYKKRDYALYRICEIEYLESRWESLERDALDGTKMGPGSYREKFSFFLLIARIQRGDYDGAEKECLRLIESDHDYHRMARTLLILSRVYRTQTGLSRVYINTIREIALGYAESDALQATLFFLGEFYEQKRMYDESYSAYSDLVSKYPGSPEAAEASNRVKALLKYNPRHVFYLPGKKIIDGTESIDISPETEVPDETSAASFYSISVGPFASVKSANEIKALLKEFDFIKTVRLKDGYAMYVGRSRDEDAALKVKIRLAEEYGINGRIVRVSGDGQRSYIYGE